MSFMNFVNTFFLFAFLVAPWCSGYCAHLTRERCWVRFPASVVTLGKFLYTNCLCWPSINWVPGCQTIGESHSGDMETLWCDG